MAAAAATVTRSSLSAPLGFILPDVEPLAHYARRLDVVAWLPRRRER